MNLIGRYERQGFTEDGERELVFSVTVPVELKKGTNYKIDLKEFKPKRSLSQNAMLWGLINKIALKEDGNLKDTNNIYAQLLEASGIQSYVISIQAEALEGFKKDSGFRVVKVVDEAMVNGKLFYTICVYPGSSKFDTAEMSTLIDQTLLRASENGIETDYWQSLLKG